MTKPSFAVVSLALGLLTLGACQKVDEREIDARHESGSAAHVYEDAANKTRTEVFEFGGDASTELVDFLFVVDNSHSMLRFIERVQDAFVVLSTPDSNGETAFPAKARIAVTSTLPADPKRPQALHRSIPRSTKAQFDPGFQRLISKDSIQKFIGAKGQGSENFTEPGCDPWFSATDRNENGVPCLVAHTQIASGGVSVEAGLTAVKQLIDLHREDPLFRPGASVNVVFVSDTHDPGVTPKNKHWQSLVDVRPEASDITASAFKAEPLSSFRMHGIVPYSACTSENFKAVGPIYVEAAESTGGVTRDLCVETDYTDLLRDIVETGRMPTRPTFALGRKPAEILEVTRDGSPVEFEQSGSVVNVVAAPLDTEAVYEVRYRFDAIVEAVAPKQQATAQRGPKR